MDRLGWVGLGYVRSSYERFEKETNFRTLNSASFYLTNRYYLFYLHLLLTIEHNLINKLVGEAPLRPTSHVPQAGNPWPRPYF